MVVCNSTLAGVRDWEVNKVAGQLTFHQLGLVICAICTLITCVVSFFLMFKHVMNYTNPKEQRQILRILLLPPIFTLITLFSYVWYWYAVYFHVARNFYEVFALASFFALMCQYIAPELSHQKEYFATMPTKSWPWPASWFNACLKGKLRAPRNGLKWFNIIWFCVFQYCAVRIGTTIIATVTQATGDYCENTLHPAFAHIWMLLFNILSITFAFYFLLTFYIILHSAISEHKPLLKFTLLFLCIWLTFWQSTILSFLSASAAIKPNKTLSPGDIAIGFNALGTCFEMMLISILHLVAYSYKPYLPDIAEFAVLEKARKPPMRAIADTLNPLDIIKSFARGMKWMLIGHRRRTEKTEKITASGKENPDIMGQHKVFIAPSSTINEEEEERTNLVPQQHELDGNIDTLPVPGTFHQHDSYVSQDSLPLHPTPTEQIPIPQHDDQEFGIAETRYEGYRPPPVFLPAPQQQTSSSSLPQQNLSRPLSSVSTPSHPHLSPSQQPQLTPTSPGSSNRQSQSPLPYPDVSTMPSIHNHQNQHNPRNSSSYAMHPDYNTVTPPQPLYQEQQQTQYPDYPPQQQQQQYIINSGYHGVSLYDRDYDYDSDSADLGQPEQLQPPVMPAALLAGGGRGSFDGSIGVGAGWIERDGGQGQAGQGQWNYTESLMDEDGVYQGPVERRTMGVEHRSGDLGAGGGVEQR